MRNLTMMTDLYQLTMMNGYLENNMQDKICIFDVFYRHNENIDLSIVAGLEQVIDYINNLKFEEEDLKYLKSLNIFSEKFIEELRKFTFSGDVFAMREGEVAFPYEPLLTVKTRLFEAQLVETAILNIINHQTLIATKAFKITNEANAMVSEFGLRRAQGPDAGIYGSRASIIGGCNSTSNVIAGQMFDIAVGGTHAHSWVMSFATEIEAFRAYAKCYPDKCLLLVDTYDTLKSGVPNAIKVFNEMKEKGYKPLGIRLDSGDLAYLSKKARKMLDDAGHSDCKIFASGDIDEFIIQSLKTQGAKIDCYGIGTKLITAFPYPALGGVYKLAVIEGDDGQFIPKMKVSDTKEKITNPGFKITYRIYDENNMAAADLICLREEVIDTTKPLTIFHPYENWKSITFEKFTLRELMVKIFEEGKQIYNSPTLTEIAEYSKKCRSQFWEEYTRLLNPHIYKVDLSQGLFNLRQNLLNNKGAN